MWLKEIILIPNTTRHERTLLGSATVENLQEVKGKMGKIKVLFSFGNSKSGGIFFFKCDDLIRNLFFLKLIYFLIAG